MSFPRCPIAVRGLDSPLLATCPGFAAEAVDFARLGHGRGVEGTSCAHLTAHRDGRGFRPACSHPRAEAMTRAAALVQAMPHVAWPALRRMPCSSIVTDAEGLVTHWNRRAETLFGWPALEAVGRSVMDTTVGTEAAAQAGEVMASVLAGEVWEGVFPARRRSGDTVLIRVLDVPMLAPSGRLAGVAGFSVPEDEGGADLRAYAESAGLLSGVAA